MRKTLAVVATIAAMALGCRGRESAVKSDTAGKAAKSAGRGATATVAAEPPAPDTSVGQTMPPYTAPLLGGGNFDLAAEKGNVVLVNLWATWCVPCRAEIPELEQLHKKHQADRFKVVGVTVDEAGEQAVRDFVKEQGMTYPVVLDPEGKLANLLQTTVLPTSVLLDRHGRIIWKQYGQVSLTDKTLTAALAKALKG